MHAKLKFRWYWVNPFNYCLMLDLVVFSAVHWRHNFSVTSTVITRLSWVSDMRVWLTDQWWQDGDKMLVQLIRWGVDKRDDRPQGSPRLVFLREPIEQWDLPCRAAKPFVQGTWDCPWERSSVFIHLSKAGLGSLVRVGISKQGPDLPIVTSLVHHNCGISFVNWGNDNGFRVPWSDGLIPPFKCV